MKDHVVACIPELVLGVLSPAEQGEARAHLSACGTCQRAYAEAVESLSLLALGSRLEPPRPSLRSELLDAVAGLAPYRGFARRLGWLFDVGEERALAMLASVHSPLGWAPHLPGASILLVEPGPGASGAVAAFVRFDAGLRYPEHEHLGDEHLFVLRGSVLDDQSGTLSLPGDISLMGPGTVHSLTIGAEEACLCAVRLEGGEPLIRAGLAR